MRIGYLFNGHLADVKLDRDGNEISTPDGNATYSWSIVWECLRRGYEVIPLGENRDEPAAERLGAGMFEAFSKQRRVDVYERLLLDGWTKLSQRKFPDLDLLLIEWRWPIPGRNTLADRGKPGYQNDLERQNELLDTYSNYDTKIVIWDLDHKIDDKIRGLVHGVLETSVAPKPGAIRVEPPFLMKDLLQFDIDETKPMHHLGYIGSRYERDEQIDHWIGPITPAGTHRVKFCGKWEPYDEVKFRWPGITFQRRIGTKGFRAAYSSAAGVPLLAKESYRQSGFVTPRIWEAILFGSIPIGLAGHLGIEQYCEYVARDAQDLLEISTELRNYSPIRRRFVRERAAERVAFMDVKNFVDRLEAIANGSEGKHGKEGT